MVVRLLWEQIVPVRFRVLRQFIWGQGIFGGGQVGRFPSARGCFRVLRHNYSLMIKEYQKLVRDLIPDIIRKKGGVPVTRVLAEAEYLGELKKKFQEELSEFLSAETPEARLEEMADIFEVITALNEAEGRDIDAVIAKQKQKREERGAFKEKIFLESVEE